MCEPNDPRVAYLAELSVKLLARGVQCELVTTGCAPRLWLDIPWLGGFEDAAFEDHVLAAPEPDGIWRFWWPWVQPIAPVDDLAGAVDHICRGAVDVFGGDDGQDDP